MLTYFPRFLSTRAIICYVVTLVLVSAFFMNFAMPFQFVLFGLGAVLLFFLYSTKLTMQWQNFSPHQFVKKLFITSLMIRVIYVIFIYFYYINMTGVPHMYHPGDELYYHDQAKIWHDEGIESFLYWNAGTEYSDMGYMWLLAFEYLLFGTNVIPSRLIKCVLSALLCVLMYHLAKRNFGESVGRMTAVFCMLMPNMWYYCGLTLKETEMAFLTVLFVERADAALKATRITFKELVFPLLIIIVMFMFRTALAAVLVAAFVVGLIFSSKKQLKTGVKILYGILFVIWMFFTVGAQMIQESQQMWASRQELQESGYQTRAVQEGGNTFAKYASASVFAPLIFTIPFSSMVNVPNQENQMMMNGANFIKNVMSGLTIFALFVLLFNKEWRKSVLPIAVLVGYLLVLVFSNFAHSERFHFPIIAFEYMFAAYGITQLTNRHKRWYTLWLIGVCVANIAWALIKLRGRGWA
jgi:hypothetical protein